MNAQQEAVALFRFLESRGFKPSVRMVGRILRDELGVKVDDHALRGFLKKFTAVAPQSTIRATASPPQKTRTNTAEPPQSFEEIIAPAPRLRARNKVSLVPKSTGAKAPGEVSEKSEARLPRPLSEPYGFAEWFLDLALAAGLVDFAGLDRDKRVKADLKAAKEILVHGVDECQRRANRFVAALSAGRLDRCKPTVNGLRSAWELGIVARDPVVQPRPGVRRGSLDDLPVTVMPL